MTSPEPTPDLHALALAATWQHYARRIHLSRKPGYQAICGCGWESAPTAKRDEADAQHSNHLADEIRDALLPAHRAMVLDEVAGLIRDEADRWDRLGYDDEGAWRAAVRIAATGAPVSAATTPPGRQDGPGATGQATAVPEATPARFWACPIPGHSVVTVEWDGDVAYCTAPGCGRSSDNEQGCNCEEYDCDGSCCGGQCSCAAAEPEGGPGRD